MQSYCDIMPHVTGWVYVVDGVQSASCYHTYELALEAARAHAAMRSEGDDRTFRYQRLNGTMMPIQATVHPAGPLPPFGGGPVFLS